MSMKKNEIPQEGIFGDYKNHQGYVHEFLEKVDNVASATECTGLTPSIPMDDEQADSYTDIYDFPVESGDSSKDKEGDLS